MVGGATNQPPQSSQFPPPQPPPSSTAPTEEEEFLKRNTDCVYFLASPLTCKKGSECEYRHSDIARVNPRDCWYWLNGNCLNPKCGFRHPPLDGLLGAEVPTPVQPSVSQSPLTPAQQGVACIFFQKGFCLKGHLCPFLHGPPTLVNNKPVQPVPPVTKPSMTASAGPEKIVQVQKFTQENVQKPVKFQPRNGGAMEKKVVPPPEEPPRYRPANVVPPPVMNEFQASRSNHGVYETNHVSDNEGINGKDVEEYSREPTPGFDVLVDTDVGDSEYYPTEEQFGRPVDYDVDRDMYPEQRDYEGYAWEDHRESSNFGSKRYPRDESSDQFDQSDLRHRISKQRRGNGNNGGGLRSVVSREHPRDNHIDRMPRRDYHHDRRNDRHHDRRLDPGSLSSRLRGRIQIPGRSTSHGNENGSRVEREFDMRRQNRSRYSPGRPPYASSNRMNFNNDGRDYREFNGPKRWSELKSQQTDDGQTLGKRKYPRSESQQSEVNASFEGPKPLSEILKRKRGPVVSSVVNIDNNNSNANNQKGSKEIASVMMVNADNEKSTDGQPCLNNEASEVENKVGSVDEDAMLDRELEAYDDQRDGDYDYEQIDGEDYNLEEGEEYFEEEEGDEAANGTKENEVYS